MTNRKLKKLLRKKPYLLNSAFSVGEDEAAALAAEHGCPSVEAILLRASLREDWPPALTEMIERLQAEPPRRQAARRRKRLLSKACHWISAHSRQLIPAAAVLLIVGFFALTPYGRGLLVGLFRPGAAPEDRSVEATVDATSAPAPSAKGPETSAPDETPAAMLLSLNAQSIPDASLRAYLIDTLGAEPDGGEYCLTEAQVLGVDSLELPDGVCDLHGLEQFPELTSLTWHADETVKTADLSGLGALRSLDLQLPSVQTIDLSANAELVTLTLHSGVQALDVSANEKLDSLTVSGGVLSDLSLGSLPELHTLTLSDNALTELDVTGCPKLEQLSVDGNELLSLDLSANTALRSVSLSGNHLKQLPTVPADAVVEGGKQSVTAPAPFAADELGLYYDMHLLVSDPSRVSFVDEGMRYDPETGILRVDAPVDRFVYRYRVGNTVFDVEVRLSEEGGVPQTPVSASPTVKSIRIVFETAYRDGDTFVRFDGSTPYMIYNGESKRPPIRVLDQNGVILNPKLYDVTYSNNVNLGTAFVHVALRGTDVSAFATFRIILQRVTGLSAYVSGGGVTVSWNAAAGTEAYLVYRSEKPYDRAEWSEAVLLGRTAEPRWSDGNVVSFMNYRYIVQTCPAGMPDFAGERAYSDPILFIAAPSLLSVSGEADEITAVWSGIDGAEGYEVQVSDDPGFSGNVYTREFFFLAMFEGMVDRLAPGVQYYVRVRAIGFNDAYMSPWSNVKSCVWE